MNNRASFIEIVTATFAAGESRLFALTGQYFEIIDATFPVDVTLSDFYGAQRGLMKSAEASFNLKGTEFGVIQITSASAQTIRFAYGTGEAGTRRAAGAVSIVGTVPVDLVQADVDALNRPELATGYWVDSSAGSGTPLTVFTPAANVNGAIVWTAESNDYLSVPTCNGGFIAKASAPASHVDGIVVAKMFIDAIVSTTNTAYKAQLQRPFRLAPGLGLYWIQNTAGTAGFGRNASYTLL